MIEIADSFHTARFDLRAPADGDEDELRHAIEETWDELHPWMPWARTKPTITDVATSLMAARAAYLARTDLRLHIFLKGTKTLVGGTGLHRMDWNVPRFEVGYWVRKSFQHQGVAQETTAFLRDLCLETWGARRVEIRCSANNLASKRVAEACGFGLEATLRHHARDYLSGELGDTLVYAIVR